MNEILDSFGVPYYHGLFTGFAVDRDNTHIGGELLVYEADDGQICFYADRESGLCQMIEYRDWLENDFIKPNEKNKPEIFNFSDCEIDGIKLGYTENQVQSIIGEIPPTSDFQSQKEHQYNSVDYTFSKGENNEWILTHMFLATDKTEGPRGIKIGDSCEDVALKFYSNRELNEASKEEKFISLYDNGYQVRGYAWFDERNEIDGIAYIYLDNDNAATLFFDIKNGVVDAISLYRPLLGMPLMP